MRAALCLCVLLVGGSVFADPPKPDVELEQRFRTELEKVSADAAVAWDQGNAARDTRFAEAETAYRKAIALAPTVDHPHRRLCGVYEQMGRLDDAVRECEQALALAPASAYDEGAIAAALLRRGHAEDHARARSLAHTAAQALPDDVATAGIDCLVRSLDRDLDDTSACVDHLLTLAPDNVAGHLMASDVALARGDFQGARIQLTRAKDSGLPAEAYAKLAARIDAAMPPRWSITLHDVIVVGVPVLGGWLVLFAILLLAGRRLSQATLHKTEELTVDDVAGTPRERRLRMLYRVVLQLTGIFFYVSLPLLVIIVIAAAIVTLIVFDEMGATPVIVLIVLAIVVLTTIISVGRTLFFTRIPKLEGKRIDPKAYPALRGVLEEAAAALDTRTVDVVYLTPGTDVGVLEQRTLFQALFGAHCQRILVLGVALFDNMKQRELRSILAHEYGHFRNADTGGGLALGVRRSLVTLLNGLGKSGYALLNPAWWLLRGFTHLYLVVSTGASRLQETLADRWAIRAYGSAAFGVGLLHVITREVEFASDMAQTLNDVVTNKWSLPNLYAYELERTKPASELEAAIHERMEREPKQFDSHPTPHQRIDWADKLALPGDRPHADDLEPVWALFPDPETIEREMTAIIRDRARTKLGVTISDAEWDD